MSLRRCLRDLTVGDIGRILTFRRPLRGAAAPPDPITLLARATGRGTPAWRLRLVRRDVETLALNYAFLACGDSGMSAEELAMQALHAADHLERFAAQLIAADVEIDVPDFIPDDLTGGPE